MDTDEWLASLKAGDEVAVRGNYGNGWWIGKVERTTPTQIIVSRSRYRRHNGHLLGETGYGSTWIEQVTPSIRNAVTRTRLIANIRDTNWGGLSTAQLQAMFDITREQPA